MIRRALGLGLATLLVAVAVQALQVPVRGVVRVSSALHIRETPNGTILGYLHDGDQVEIIDTSGAWYRINFGSFRGKYSHSRYIEVTEYRDVDDSDAAKHPYTTLRRTDLNRPANNSPRDPQFETRPAPVPNAAP